MRIAMLLNNELISFGAFSIVRRSTLELQEKIDADRGMPQKIACKKNLC